MQAIIDKVQSGARISREEAKTLFLEASDDTLRELASCVRARFHAPDEATYLIMGIINYTNICVAQCDYCSFYRLPGHKEGYLLSPDQVCARIEQVANLGGTVVGFNGGFNPELKLQDYAALFQEIHRRFPNMSFKEMTVAEFVYACKVSRIDFAEGAKIMTEAGTQWLTGGGAEVMDEGFRKRHSAGKGTVARYYEAQRAILDAGIGSTATMVIGFDETLDERLTHLDDLRNFQDSVDGRLASFLCWTYKSYGTALGGQEVDTPEYLRWLALSRIYLDNIVHIRASVLTKNEDALLGLQYGANDFDLPTEDEVTQKAGATISHDFGRILDAAENIGFRCVHRAAFPKHPRAGHTYVASGLDRSALLGRPQEARFRSGQSLPVVA